MATAQPVWWRKGVTINCDQSMYPAPVPQSSYPFPAFPSVETSLLELTLQAVSGSYVTAIQINSTGVLPGSSKAIWTLYHQYYQYPEPATLPNPDTVPLSLVAGAINQLLVNPMADAIHNFWLVCVDGTQTTTYPPSTITTPADKTSGVIGGVSSGNLIPNWDSSLGVVDGIGGACVFDTLGQASSGYLGARYVRSTSLSTTTDNNGFSITPITTNIACLAGDIFNLNYWITNPAVIPSSYIGQIQLIFYDSSGNSLGNGIASTGLRTSYSIYKPIGGWPAGVWQNNLAQIMAPANTAYVVANIYGGFSGVSVYWFGPMAMTLASAPATTSVAGAVKVGAGLTASSDGTISAVVTSIGAGLSITSAGVLAVTGASGTPANTSWGYLTGSITSQTDLQGALSAMAPLAGAKFTGPVTAPSFAGNGAGLTGIPLSAVTGMADYFQKYNIDGGGAFDIGIGQGLDGGRANTIYGGTAKLNCGGVN